MILKQKIQDKLDKKEPLTRKEAREYIQWSLHTIKKHGQKTS